MFEEQPLFMKKKPNFGKDFLIIKEKGQKDLVYKEKIKDGLFECYNDASFKATNSNGDIIEEGYLTSLGLHYVKDSLGLIDIKGRYEKMKRLSELFTEEWRNNEIGWRWHEEYSPEILDSRKGSKRGSFRVLPKEKKQGMCR